MTPETTLIDPEIRRRASGLLEAEGDFSTFVLADVYERVASVALEASRDPLFEAARLCADRGAITRDTAVVEGDIRVFAPQRAPHDHFLVVESAAGDVLVCLQLGDKPDPAFDKMMRSIAEEAGEDFDEAQHERHRVSQRNRVFKMAVALSIDLERDMKAWAQDEYIAPLAQKIRDYAPLPSVDDRHAHWERSEAAARHHQSWPAVFPALSRALAALGLDDDLRRSMVSVLGRDYQEHETDSQYLAAGSLGTWVATLDEGLPGPRGFQALQDLSLLHVETSFVPALRSLTAVTTRCTQLELDDRRRAVEMGADRYAWRPAPRGAVELAMCSQNGMFGMVRRSMDELTVHAGPAEASRLDAVWLATVAQSPEVDLLARFVAGDSGWQLLGPQEIAFERMRDWNEFVSIAHHAAAQLLEEYPVAAAPPPPAEPTPR